MDIGSSTNNDRGDRQSMAVTDYRFPSSLKVKHDVGILICMS